MISKLQKSLICDDWISDVCSNDSLPLRDQTRELRVTDPQTAGLRPVACSSQATPSPAPGALFLTSRDPSDPCRMMPLPAASPGGPHSAAWPGLSSLTVPGREAGGGSRGPERAGSPAAVCFCLPVVLISHSARQGPFPWAVGHLCWMTRLSQANTVHASHVPLPFVLSASVRWFGRLQEAQR